ncbi:MAG: single-stranded DNA-binding protein [Sedimentisphaerales bacterium]|nr:single-stranded DNA-binding protein [Sedimentisphaerales bacterium]
MASFNKIIIMGNLTRDPELTYLPSQTPVVEFGIAANHRYKGSDGQMKEDTCFVDCRMFGARAEVISKYCRKGEPILIEGRLQYDRWEAQDGSKRSKHRIFVENFSFVGQRAAGTANNAVMSHSHTNNNDMAGDDNVPDRPPDDDIPF